MKNINEKFNYEEIFKDKKSILIVTGHPDDTTVYFGALIHQLRKDKKEVYILVVSNGARGSRNSKISESQLIKQRLQEEREALKILGVNDKNLFFLGYKDGEIESNLKLIEKIAYFIRKLKIDIIGTHDPASQYMQTYNKDGYFVQHRDHRKVGEAVIDACYPFSRDRSFFPNHQKEGIEPHTVYDVLLTDETHCNFDFNYTENMEVKKAAYRAHKSQFDSDEHIQEWLDAVKFNGKYFEKFNYVKLLW